MKIIKEYCNMKVSASHVKREGKMHTKRQVKAEKEICCLRVCRQGTAWFLRCCVQDDDGDDDIE